MLTVLANIMGTLTSWMLVLMGLGGAGVLLYGVLALALK
jgi:hypothetical protein